MTVDKWATDDVIAEESINKRSVRKGTTNELKTVNIGTLHEGDLLYDETDRNMKVVYNADNADRSLSKLTNIKALINADSEKVIHTGTTPIAYKEFPFIKSDTGFTGNRLYIIANLYSIGTGTSTIKINVNGTYTQSIQTTSIDITNIQEAAIDITSLSNGKYILEFTLEHSTSTGQTVLEDVEIWGV